MTRSELARLRSCLALISANATTALNLAGPRDITYPTIGKDINGTGSGSIQEDLRAIRFLATYCDGTLCEQKKALLTQ